MSSEAIFALSRPYWPESATRSDEGYKKQVIGLVQERLKFLAELPELTNFFFEDLPVNLELVSSHKQLKKIELTELVSLLQQAATTLQKSDFSVQDLTNRLNILLESTEQKPAVLFSLVRIATTWSPSSPGLADTLHVLGKETSIRRINASLSALATNAS